jgi:hypothetical protein
VPSELERIVAELVATCRDVTALHAQLLAMSESLQRASATAAMAPRGPNSPGTVAAASLLQQAAVSCARAAASLVYAQSTSDEWAARTVGGGGAAPLDPHAVPSGTGASGGTAAREPAIDFPPDDERSGYGLDHAPLGETPLRPDGAPAMHWVVQGALGDCYLLAALAAVCGAEPDLAASLVTTLDDEMAGVTLHVDGRAQLVELARSRVVTADGGPAFGRDLGGSAFTSLVEKAYVAVVRGGSYAGSEGGWPDEALAILTGRPAARSHPAAVTPVQLARLVADGPVVVSTRENGRGELAGFAQAGLVPLHAYAVASCDAAGGLVLYDPHGVYVDLDWPTFQRYFDDVAWCRGTGEEP